MVVCEAGTFYGVHRERPFFEGLVRFMTSGPVMIQVLEGEGAIARHRELMGATDPQKAAPGARSALISPNRCSATPCMVRTGRKRRAPKLLFLS